MSTDDATVVLVHGAWADGSSWAKVIAGLRSAGVRSVAVPVPLTSFDDDIAALDRTLERVEGPVVLVGHAYAGAVVAGDPFGQGGSARLHFRAGPGSGGKRSPTCSIAWNPTPWRRNWRRMVAG